MEPFEACLRSKLRMWAGHAKIDSKLRIGDREHLIELFLLPALRKHPQRTMDRDEANLFVIAYSAGQETASSLSPPLQLLDDLVRSTSTVDE